MNIKPVHCAVVHENKMGGELVLVGKGEGGQVGGLGAHTEPGLVRGGGDGSQRKTTESRSRQRRPVWQKAPGR